MMSMMVVGLPSALLLLLGIAAKHPAAAEPLSAPYVCYRTDPYNTPPTSVNNHYHTGQIFGDHIINATLDGRRGSPAKRGSRGRARVRPVEVSPASADERQAATDGAAGAGSAASGRARVGGEGDPRCPLAFRLGLTHRSSGGGGSSGTSGINGPVLTYAAHPARGPGRQVIFLENWERVDMLTPSQVPRSAARRGEEEAMEIDEQFPLLFEGSNFYHSVPVLHDENGDGVMDITMIDYDGGVYTVGLDFNPDESGSSNNNHRERYVKTAQVPRLYLRKDWVESATNLTKMEEYTNPPTEDNVDEDGNLRDYNRYRTANPPFHSYFEYGLEWKEEHDNKRIGVSGGAVSADVLSQSVEDVQKIEDERMRRWKEAQEEILGKKKQQEEAEAQAAAAATAEVEAEKKDDDTEGLKEPEAIVSTNAQHESDGVPEYEDGGGDAARGDRRRRLEEIPPDSQADANVDTKADDSQADANVDTKATSDQVKDNQEADTKDPPADTPEIPDVKDEGSDKTAEAATESTSTGDNVEGANAEGQDVLEEIDAIPVDKKKKAKATKPEPVVPDKKVEGEPCGDCYGAAEEDECCNTCAQVIAAYKVKHWGVKKADIAQCVEEGDLDDSKPDEPYYRQDDDEFYGEDRPDDDVAAPRGYGGDDDKGIAAAPYEGFDDEYMRHGYDDYYPQDDHYGGYGGSGGGGGHYDNFYSDENYIRVTPHVLARPLYVEVPKRYKGSDDPEWAVEEYLVVPVSYYLDEDEFRGLQSYRRFKNKEGGDETETERGQYVANAILFYNTGYKQWSTQTHLDLSTDWTAPVNTTVGDAPIHDDTFNGYGAFALSSPTVAILGQDSYDSSPKYHVVMGTSMGFLYVLELPGGSKRDGFPVRFPYPIVRGAVVEDVAGDVTPEIIAVDAGGNVACLDNDGTTLWHRDVIEGEREQWKVMGTSEMSLGDVDGDGKLDVVLVVRLISAGNSRKRLDELRVYAIEATSGDDLARFPMAIDVPSSGLKDDRGHVADAELPLPQPLLVDLHASQDYWLERLRRNETDDTRSALEKDAAEARRINTEASNAPLPEQNTKVPHGGSGRGLHIVQPVKDNLYIIEGGTGCTQTINVGDTIPSMVQVDDVHGTGALDLIVTTASGQVITLEASDAVPFHPLNVWNTGPVRSRINGHAQGYSASSGIFVHERSRTYKNWLGIYVMITLEIFDRRPNAWKEEPEQRKYTVDLRSGSSTKKMLFRKIYDHPGIYTEQVFVPFGPGYYSIIARLTTTHGLVYEDNFSFGYNVDFASGLAWIVLMPLVVAAIPLLLVRRKTTYEDDDFSSTGARGRILG